MASSNYLRHEMFEKLSPQLQGWIRELDYWGYGRAAGATDHRHIEERLGITRGGGRVIPPHTAGRVTLPGTDYQFVIYPTRSAGRHGRAAKHRVFAFCPECHKEVEAGHVRQHAFKHVPKGDVAQLAADVREMLK